MSLAHNTVPDSVVDVADAVVLHQGDAARLVRSGRRAFLFGLVPVLAWLMLAPLVSAVVAAGFVKVDMDRIPVQHADGGTVAQVHVRDGQTVRRGEPLLVLGEVQVSADLDRLTFRVVAEQAAMARLEAEQARAPALLFAVELRDAARTDPRVAEQLAKEAQLFAARRDALEGQLALLRRQRERIGQEMQQLRQQIAAAVTSLQHQHNELATHHELLRDGFVSQTRVAQLEAQVADYGVKLAEKRSDLVRAEQRIGEADLRTVGLESEYRQQSSDQLKATAQRLSELQQEHRKAVDAARRQTIAAPADGVVMGLRAAAVGTVIAPREVMAEIVPADQQLIIEARIRPEDIDQVHVGDNADLRLTAFEARTTASVAGRVIYVSADRSVDPASHVAHYIARVEARSDSLRAAGGLQLQAGMPVEVFVTGQRRSAMAYLVEPLVVAIRRGARER